MCAENFVSHFYKKSGSQEITEKQARPTCASASCYFLCDMGHRRQAAVGVLDSPSGYHVRGLVSFREICCCLSWCVHYTRSIRGNPWNNNGSFLYFWGKGLGGSCETWQFHQKTEANECSSLSGVSKCWLLWHDFSRCDILWTHDVVTGVIMTTKPWRHLSLLV